MSMDHDNSEPLAIHGGPKAKRTPFPTGKRHGDQEKRLLGEVIDSDMLFYFLGTKVFELQRRFARMYGVKHAIACSSGTAAVHIAIASLALPAGSEIIVPAITDMGSLTGILYQGLVPVFADVDPDTLNICPASTKKLITGKTRAILAVHHSGLAAGMDALLAIGREHGIPVVEDCAQAYCCEYQGKLAGTMGTVSAFSLNHFKHITCGSGGVVLTDDGQLRYRASLYLDKCFQREEGIRNPFFLAPNYQMTEMQGAVALAQLEKVDAIVARRRTLGERLDRQLAALPAIFPQKTPAEQKHSYFLYLFRLDLEALRCTADEFADAVKAEGIPCAARQITGGRPIYLYDVFQNRSAFPGTSYPFAEDRYYRQGDCPIAEEAFKRWITMNIYEHYTEQDIDEIAVGIGKVARHFTSRQGVRA